MAGNGEGIVSWQAPRDDGGTPVLYYEIMVFPGGRRINAPATRREQTVIGLTNGTEYTFQVAAVNQVGTSWSWRATNPVTPSGGSGTAAGASEPTATATAEAEPTPTPEPTATPGATPTPPPFSGSPDEPPEFEPRPLPTVQPTIAVPTPSPTAVPEAIQTLVMNAGWNLVSFQVLPGDTSVETVFAPLSGLYVEISTVVDGVSLVYRPGAAPGENTLLSVDSSHGYWVKLREAASLDVLGVPAQPPAIELQQGWNLIAFSSSEPLAIPDALRSVDGLYTEVRGFDGEGVSYIPGMPAQFNTLMTMYPGSGYLVHMQEDATLVYAD